MDKLPKRNNPEELERWKNRNDPAEIQRRLEEGRRIYEMWLKDKRSIFMNCPDCVKK